MSPQVSVPIFSAESRECSTQFVMVTLQQGPYRRVIGPVALTTIASSPVWIRQPLMITSWQQSGSMPSLLAPRSSLRMRMSRMRTRRHPAMCSVQKAASRSVTSRIVRSVMSSSRIIRGRNAAAALGHSPNPLSSLRSKNTRRPCPSMTPLPEIVMSCPPQAPRKKPPFQPSIASSASAWRNGRMSSGRRLDCSTAPLHRCSSTWERSITLPLRNRPAGTMTRPPPACAAASTAAWMAAAQLVTPSATAPYSVIQYSCIMVPPGLSPWAASSSRGI